MSRAFTRFSDNLVRRIWLPLASLTLCAVCQGQSSLSNDATIDQSMLDGFKRFVSAPPTIDGVVYRIITTGNPDKGLPLEEGGHSTNDGVVYFLARWQPDCLFLKSGTNFDAEQTIQAGEEVNSRFHSEYWRRDPVGILRFWQDPARSLAEIRILPSRVYHMRTHQFKELMNMGVMQVDVGALKWNGRDFTATGFVPESRTAVDVRGKLISDTSGLAKQMTVEYRSRMGIYHYALRYSYHTNVGLPFLPSTIQSFFLLQGREVKLMECDIFSLRTRQTNMERNSFDVQELSNPKVTPVVRYTKGNWYAQNLLGGWTPLPSRDDAPVKGFQLADGMFTTNGLYLWATLAVGLITFSIVWRINNKTNKRKEAKS